MNKKALIIFLMCFSFISMCGQDSLKTKKRIKTIAVVNSSIYGVSLIGLNALWYSNSEQTSFHFFNDNKQWSQIDKAGHLYTAFHISRLSGDLYAWAGLNNKKVAFWGAFTGFMFQTPIEILDGFSPEFGASWGDLIANTLGSGAYYVQQRFHGKIGIMPKFSFSRSPYASVRPNTLGSNALEELLKDYNGQTYWLSISPSYYLKNTKFPKWLNVAVGYGADEIIFGSPDENRANGFESRRQLYLSLDLNLREIKTRYKVLNKVLNVFDAIKIPAPALRLEEGGLKFLPIYF